MQYNHILLCSVYVVKIIWVNGDLNYKTVQLIGLELVGYRNAMARSQAL